MLCDANVEKIDMKNLYSSLGQRKREIEKGNPIYLYQRDFDHGTYLIEKPGYYVLKENIVFNPNRQDDHMPRPNQTKYQTPGFSLGFFAVIAIYADGVYLDLNMFTIKASKEFTLQQRFFSIIELANSPFVFGQGPGAFSTATSFVPASNTIIRNGVLALSSHHGIHGNMATRILLEKLVIEDFEFVGVALNGCHSLFLNKVDIKNNRQDIPVLATYSAARFARMFAKRVLLMPVLSPMERVELAEKLAALEREMDKTFHEVIRTGKTKSSLFNNKTGLPDGNIYGLMIKNRGLAVDELVSPAAGVIKTKNVFLRKVKVENLVCRVDEIVTLSQKGGLGVQNDSAGAVLQIDKIKDTNGIYKGTLLSELQLYMAELSHILHIPLGKLNISPDTVEWAKSGQSIETLLSKGYVYKIGGDSMAHLNKFSAAYRFDAIDNLVLKNLYFNKVKNTACLGCDYSGCKMLDSSKRNGEYPGASSVGLNLAYCSDVSIHKFYGEKVYSKDGDATGIHIMFGSENIEIDGVTLRNIKAGTLCKNKWIGRAYNGKRVKYSNRLPNKKPQAVGIKYETLPSLKNINISDLRSCEPERKFLSI